MGRSPVYCRVPWLCCVEAQGEDAYDFLHRQLTNDPPADDGRFTLAAWNDPKGRVRALFRILRGADGPLLIAERDGIDAVLAKLRIFVLRSDVRFALSRTLEVGALIGDSDALLEARGIALGAERGAVARADELLWLRQSPELLNVVGPGSALEQLGAKLEPAAEQEAARAEIRAGLPYVGAALSERYVPQMLNLDRLEGVAFDKGCYPGQEVVARLHHLGSVKRRLRAFRADAKTAAPPAPGTPVLDAAGTEVGDVVRAAVVDGRLELLAVVQLDAVDKGLVVHAEEPLPLVPASEDDGPHAAESPSLA